MTTEEKAKAYDEALSQARFYYGNCPTEPEKKKLEKLFPELRESDDEKIRKGLIQHLKELSECNYNGGSIPIKFPEHYKAWIAWLEKQKENPKTTYSMPSNCVPDAIWASSILTNAIVALANSVDYNRSGPLIYSKEIDALKRLREEIEKQKEQKPTELSDDFELALEQFLMNADSSSNTFAEDVKKYANRLREIARKENKPAEWSEEDEENIGKLHRLLIICQGEKKFIPASEYEKLDNWLKDLSFSLKKRNENIEKLCSNEWSEEDDALLKEIVSFFKDGTVKLQHDLNLYAGFLEKKFKSLRPQPKVELTLLDENIINAAVAFVEQNDHFNCWGAIDKRTVITALRSLKPHWAPSEEQMDALKLIVSNKKHYAPVLHEIALDTLYNDLKKL